MNPENTWRRSAASGYFAPLERYRDTVSRLFPALPERAMDRYSMSPSDALALGYFLEHYPRRVSVVEVGTFVGASAFFFASHPKVSRVLSFDPNLALPDELTANSDTWTGRVDFDSLRDVRAFDVARAVLEEFREEREKIELREGVVGSTQVGVKGLAVEDSKRLEVPEIVASEDEGLVAFVDGLHTREGVLADLEAIFGRNPHATVFLDDCRHAWGPFVQAGAADFTERAAGEHHFQLVGDLGPALAGSNLGILYPDSNAAETRKTLAEVGHVFSRRLDPLRLLSREEELISNVNRTNQELGQARRQSRRNSQSNEDNSQLKKENGRLKKNNVRLKKNNERLKNDYDQLKKNNGRLEERNSWLEQKNSQLILHNSSGRYRLADALVGGVLRVPGMRGLLRRDKHSRDH